MDKYLVEVKNKFFGNSSHILTMKEIENFNLIAFELAKICVDGKSHTAGMWTVTKLED